MTALGIFATGLLDYIWIKAAFLPSFHIVTRICNFGPHLALGLTRALWFARLKGDAVITKSRVSVRLNTPRLLIGGVLCLNLCVGDVQAQSATNQGFTVNRYEPTAAGEWSFGVDHPWYSSTRYFAAGITLNYGHNPLVFGRVTSSGFSQTTAVIEHQFLSHIDLAGSFLDRILLTGSLPITWLERGTPAAGVSASAQVSVGDPRLGLWVRLFGQPYRSAIAMSLGANAWIPLRGLGATDGVSDKSSDSGFRILPKLVLGGLSHRVLWSLTGGFMYRPAARLGVGVDDSGSTIGSEVQLGAAIAYADTHLRLAVGPELVASTVVLGSANVKPFSRDYTSVEALLGLHYNIAHLLQLGIGGGLGLLRTPGTPDGRVLLRLAYAPWPKEPAKVVEQDRDRDGILDADDRCPDVHKGERPDPERVGCPIADRDADGFLDPDDRCPDVAAGPHPDPQRPGCPQGDRDGDGVLDAADLCPDTDKGPRPDAQRLGCPTGDRDRDGVLDPDDQCPDLHHGPKPDPQKPGCPAKDRDHDTVVDPEDACPDQAGAPSRDPKKNGCPSLVVVSDGKLQILAPVFFATNKDVILAKSTPVLTAVSEALKASPEIKKLMVEGHTDDRGKSAYNRDLSDRRARSVVKWLIGQGGIAQDRLQSKGYGPDRPIADNKTATGREKNRRVEFVIIDPPQSSSVRTLDAASVAVPDSPDQSDGNGGKKRQKRSKSSK